MQIRNLAYRMPTAVVFVLLAFLFGAGPAPAQDLRQTEPPPSEPGQDLGQTELPPVPATATAPPYATEGKLQLQFEGYYGLGIEANTVGVTSDGEDVKISGGGGGGLGVSLGYGISPHVDIQGTLGVQASALRPAVKNADGTFGRSFVLATLKYRVPIREGLQWKFGIGAGYYAGEMDIDIDPGVPGAGHLVVEYKNAVGAHATGEIEIAIRERLFLAAGLKYYAVTYRADKVRFNDASLPVSSLKDEFRNLNGDGVDITVGLGVVF